MFFPSPAERALPAFVRAEFPFPVALTCTRLEAQMERDEPVAAAWALRDAFECAVKFTACAAVADFLQAQPAQDEAAALAGLLLKPQGLSLGDWHTLLGMALAPLATLARDGRLDASGRRLPELFGTFFQAGARKKPSPTALNASMDGSDKSFVAWRNRVFGHGVFQEERSYYADETLKRLPDLVRFYEALRPVLAGWRLIGLTPGGERVAWTGCEAPLAATTGDRHEHKPWGEPLPMRLVPQDHPGRAELDFGPLLTVQRCEVCGEPAAFFFDRHRYDRERDKHRTHFLEYLRGHPGERKDWSEARRLAGLLPAGFEWQRTAWDVEEVVEGVRLTFADFETEYLRPAYLLDALWQAVADRPGGYVHVAGPAGVGKTYLVRGLEKESAERGVPVLAYHILAGARADYQTFVGELHATACERLPHARTVQPQVAVGSVAELQEQFAGYLTTLMKANRLDALVLVIDALDELAEPDGTSPVNAVTILDLLPHAGKLPEGCFVVLTSRPEMRPGIRERLDRIRTTAGEERFVALDVRPDAPANEALLRAYLSARLPGPFRAECHAKEVLRRSGGVFLYAYHLARALAAGAFADTAALPEGKDFYPAYLARLRERVGAELYESVYLPALLMLAAAQVPVTLEQLSQWGVPGDRLRFALIDLRDFLRVHRVRPWHESLNPKGDNRYEMAHEGFAQFVKAEAALAESLRRCHEVIAAHAVANGRRGWRNLDPTDDADLYDLRFVAEHARQGGRADWAEELEHDEPYADGCSVAADRLQEKARLHLALALSVCAERVHRRLFEEQGRSEAGRDLAIVLLNKGDALRDLGKLREAVATHEDAIAILRPLVEEQGGSGLIEALAANLKSNSRVLLDLRRPREAMTACDEAIDVLRLRIDEPGRPELARQLALAFTNKAVALRQLGRVPEAVAAYDQMIVLCRRFVEDGHGELTSSLAVALTNKGAALHGLGRFAEAVATYEQAIAVLGGPAQEQDRGREGNQAILLANGLMNKGIALQGLGQMQEALVAHEQAVVILEPLVDEQAGVELVSALATAFRKKGAALGALGRLAEMAAAYDRAIAILRRPVEEQRRTELADALATTLLNKCGSLSAWGRVQEEVTAYDQAIVILRRLIEEQHCGGLASSLAQALLNKGVRLRELGRFAEAVAADDQAIGLLRRLIEERGRNELDDDPADWPEADDLGDSGVARLPRSGPHRSEVACSLALALMNKGVALEPLARVPDALTCYDEAILIRERLVNEGSSHLIPDLVRGYAIRFDVHRQVGNWAGVAADVRLALTRALPPFQRGEPSPPLKREVSKLIDALGQLSQEERGRLDAALGEDAGRVRAWIASAQPARVEKAVPSLPPLPTGRRVGRNDLCPCGSGKKYKKCHGKRS
jgi:tetratricopeptide (TPR) repeat protein